MSISLDEIAHYGRSLSLNRLDEDSSRLFVSSVHVPGLIYAVVGEEGVKLHEVTEDASLIPNIDAYRGSDIFYLIKQEFSWGRFCITQQMFQHLLSLYSVFLPFLDLINAYGKRLDEDTRIRDGYYVQFFSLPDAAETSHFELCYQMRHVEKNGRSWGDPWSLRQTAIYQRFDLKSKTSTWILVQPSGHIQDYLKNIPKCRLQEDNESSRNFMSLHMIFLLSMERNWGDYIEDLLMQVNDLDRKACFSRVGCKFTYDYSVAFSDCQCLQLLQTKLARIDSVLESCGDIAKSLRTHCRKLQALGVLPCSDGIEGHINIYISRVGSHRRSIGNMKQRLLGTLNLLSQILQFRNDEVLQQTNQAIRTSLDVMQQITSHIHQENKLLTSLTSKIHQENALLTSLTSQNQRDSKALKSLTLIATMFLPATLIATLFGSPLIQLGPDSDGGKEATHFVVVAQFWIYAVISTALTALTFGIKWLLERGGPRSAGSVNEDQEQ